MMTEREYIARRNNAHKAHREVINALEKFAKRSKHIKVFRKATYWGHCRIDVILTKDGKVVQEMMEYLKSLCSYYEPADMNDKYPTDCFRNYDEWAEEEEDSEWEVQFEIIVYHR